MLSIAVLRLLQFQDSIRSLTQFNDPVQFFYANIPLYYKPLWIREIRVIRVIRDSDKKKVKHWKGEVKQRGDAVHSERSLYFNQNHVHPRILRIMILTKKLQGSKISRFSGWRGWTLRTLVWFAEVKFRLLFLAFASFASWAKSWSSDTSLWSLSNTLKGNLRTEVS